MLDVELQSTTGSIRFGWKIDAPWQPVAPIAQQKIPYSLNQYTQRCYFSSLISNIYMIYYLQWVLD